MFITTKIYMTGYYSSPMDTGTMEQLIPIGPITMVILLGIGSLLIITGVFFKQGKIDLEFNKMQSLWLILAIGGMVMIIIFISLITTELQQDLGGYGQVSTWDIIDPRFGIIGPFIGGAIVVVGFILSKMQIINSQEQLQGSQHQNLPKPHQKSSSASSSNICPTCKNRIDSNSKFCDQCGTEI
ncbi:MAG: zinc ribbon domain-containing protein [Promethearchaeia archaeon]